MARMETWIAALSSLILVVVTTWYAVLTRSLAKSARDSAASAERAAKTAADALAASIASVDVSFSVSPEWRPGTGGNSLFGVTLHCTGATVFVHGAMISELWKHENEAWSDPDEERLLASRHSMRIDDRGTFAEVARPLPVRLHRDEVLHFDAGLSDTVPVASAGHMEIVIRYSIAADGEHLTRYVTWDPYDG